MRTSEPMTESEQAHRLSENLMSHLAKGREWATPGVQVAVQRAVAGLDTGIDTASPRVQALLHRLAEELAGGVETLTPRVQEQLKRVRPEAAAPVPDAGRRSSRMWWWIGGLAVLAGAGAALRRSVWVPKEEPAASISGQETGPTAPDDGTDLTAGRL